MCHSNLLAWQLHCRGKEFSAPHYVFKGFWVEAHFGISEGVDFTAISFMKNPEFVKCLKNYLKAWAPDRSFYLHQGIFSANKALSLGSQANMFIIGPEPMTCPLETGVTLDQLNIPMVLKAPIAHGLWAIGV